MADMQPQADMTPHGETRGPGYEPSDVGIRGIFTFGLGLIVLAIVVLVVLRGYMHYFMGEEKRLAALRPARFAENGGQFPAPRLQGNPAKDTAELIQTERDDLRSYGWADPSAKVAKIPIERAMDLVLERGLPVHKDATPRSASPTK